MSPGPADRRIHPRARFRGIAVLEARGRTYPCTAGNLSESGMLLFSESPVRIEPGPVGVVFTLPGFGQWLTVVGEVVHQVLLATRTVLGVHFTAVGDELRETLRRFVDATRLDLPAAPGAGKPSRPDLPSPPSVPVVPLSPQPARRPPSEELDLPPRPIAASLPELPFEPTESGRQDEETLLLEGFDQIAEGAFADDATKRAVVDVLSVLKDRAQAAKRGTR
jgi:hypothetical protein